MYPITTGDSLHLMGPFGVHVDYTVRLILNMADEVDGAILGEAVKKTQGRYPYFSLRLRKNESGFYYEDNPAPVVVHHSDGRVSLNAEESNFHVWSVSYNEDRLYLDFFHGIADGTGMYMLLSTLLYYYCAARYGVTDHTGIRTLEDPILPEETIDPLDALPQLDPSLLKAGDREPVFSLIEDGGLTRAEQPVIWDIELPESAFIRFSSANDASPGTMVSILLARAIDELFPKRTKRLTGGYVFNARPMLRAQQTHHNCVSNVVFDYTDRVKAMPFDRQCTVHRGTTFIQSDTDRARSAMMGFAGISRMVLQTAPTAEAKKQAFGQMLAAGNTRYSYIVSYVGQWRQKSLSPYIRAFWTHVPCVTGLIGEIAAINGKIFLSVNQAFREDAVVKSFLRQLDENGIPNQLKQSSGADIAHFPEPEVS